MANEMKFSGRITAISEVKTGTGTKGEWQSQTVIITEDKDQYPQSVAIDCFNKQDEIAKVSIGCSCDVLFNMEAKEYNSRWFGSNRLWKFDNIVGSKAEPQSIEPTQAEGSDLPFN